MNRAAFFAAIRKSLFGGSLQPGQVERVEILLDAIERADWPLAYAAYAFGTAHHETAKWQHLKELGGSTYFTRMYDKTGERPKVAATLGNTEVGDGARFAGRGFVQLTGRANYRKAGTAIGIDLIKEPQRAEEPAIAARLLIWGMETGAYTGKACRDYLDKTPPDYVGARRIINGTDRASMVAGYAREFAAALMAGGYGTKPAQTGAISRNVTQSDATQPPAVITRDKPIKPPSFWGSLFAAILSAFKGKR